MKTNMNEVSEKGLTLYQMTIFLSFRIENIFPDPEMAVDQITVYISIRVKKAL